MIEQIERGDSRDMNEQVDVVLATISGNYQLTDEDSRRLDRSVRYFPLAVAGQSGWGDEHVLKSARKFVETVNDMHAASDGQLISPQVSESLCNFIHNTLVVGEYSGNDNDPTKPWREW